MPKILRFAAVLSFVVILGPWSRSASAQTTMTWTVDGVQREAIVFAPPSPSPTVAATKRPLIFAFHGHGGNAQGVSQMMGLQNFWPEAIVVYPQGLPSPTPNDPQATKPGFQFKAGDSGDRDLKFFDAMLATMKQSYGVDAARVYSTGFSNGAIFSYLLWAERGNTFAAFGICAGALMDSVHPSTPRPVFVIAGENDQTLPFAMQEDAIEKDRQFDNATGPAQACGQNCNFYPSTGQTPVKTIIHPKGHVYPPWAGQAIVTFFKNHSL